MICRILRDKLNTVTEEVFLYEKKYEEEFKDIPEKVIKACNHQEVVRVFTVNSTQYQCGDIIY